MKYSPVSAIVLSYLSLSTLGIGLFLKSGSEKYVFLLLLTSGIALIIPIVSIVISHSVRIDRLKAAEVFRKTYHLRLGHHIYLDFVGRKYAAGFHSLDVADLVKTAKFHVPSSSDWYVLAGSLPFVALVGAGLCAVLVPMPALIAWLAADGSFLSLADAIPAQIAEGAKTIAAFAFGGSLLFSLRSVFGSVVSFDLSPFTFLRAFGHTLFSIVLAVVLWLAAPSAAPLEGAVSAIGASVVGTKVSEGTARERVPAAVEGEAPSAKPPAASGQAAAVSRVWIVFAFGLGLIPAAGFAWLLRRLRITLDRHRAKVERQIAVTPLTIIDGIDFSTAFRLQEHGLGCVPQLAVSNPIMLHIETPYCIAAIMDWIGQAQLCAATGPQRFLLLRKINVRTLLDLERAVLDPSAPSGLKQIVGAVLLASDGTPSSILRDFGIRPLDVTHRDFDKALSSWVNVEVIEHLVRLMIDHLHVHRYREILRDLKTAYAVKEPEEQRLPAFKISPSQVMVTGSGTGRPSSRDVLQRDIEPDPLSGRELQSLDRS